MEDRVRTLLLILLLTSMSTFLSGISHVNSELRTWIVDDDGPADFRSIQQAVDQVNSGDIIYVRSGTYRENVAIYKNLSLLGEEGAIVRAANAGSAAFQISVNNVNLTGFQITEACNGIFLQEAENCLVSNNTVFSSGCSERGTGITLNFSDHNDIRENYVIEYCNGILLSDSNHNDIYDNTVQESNDVYDFAIFNSTDNMIVNNTIQGYKGFYTFYAGGNVLKNNTIGGSLPCPFIVSGVSLSDYLIDVDTSNTVYWRPIYYWINQKDKEIPSGAGMVVIVNSTNISVKNQNWVAVQFAYTNNSLIDNVDTFHTIGLHLYESYNNTICESDLRENWGFPSRCNINLANSTNNRFYHNNMDIPDAIIYKNEPGNLWDNDYPAGGNFWGNYNGTDFYNGPYQNITGSDGIGDVPYVIGENNVDRYPLMYPHEGILGDVLHDGTVDIYDALVFADVFNAMPSGPNWNPYADFNHDNAIDIFDAIILAGNFGKVA